MAYEIIDNKCLVPSEILNSNELSFKVNVVGTNESGLYILPTSVEYVRLNKTGSLDGVQPSENAPTIYQKLVSEVNASFSDLTYEFNRDSGKLKLNFISNDKSVKSFEVDLPTEELVKNVEYDVDNSQIVIEWENGQTTNIPMNSGLEEISRNLTNISNAHINNIAKQYAIGYSNTEISNNYDWSQITSPISNRSRSCCYGNGYYVVAGTSGDLAYSTDGVNWTKLIPFTSGVITGVTYGNGKFLAVDSNGLFWSCNLTPYGEWSNIYTTTIQLEGIRFINDRFFVVGVSGYLAYSIDGINWQELNSNTTKDLIDITYGQGKYIAVGIDGTMVYSLNAQEWYDNTDPSFTTSYRHIAYGKNMFVAGGQNGVMRYSYDGLIWQNGTKNSTATVGWVRGFAYASGRFYSIIYTTGGAGEVWYSQDGISWEVVYQTPGRLWTICEGDGTFITSGDSGKIYTLDLGIEWTNIKPQGEFDIYYRFILSKNNGNIVYSENYYDGKGSSGGKLYKHYIVLQANIIGSTIMMVYLNIYNTNNETFTSNTLKEYLKNYGAFVASGFVTNNANIYIANAISYSTSNNSFKLIFTYSTLSITDGNITSNQYSNTLQTGITFNADKVTEL